MKDGANVGQWLEENPDIRDRVAALAKNPMTRQRCAVISTSSARWVSERT
jgi:hypothetical protein